MTRPVVVAEGLGKRYALHRDRPRSLVEWLARGWRGAGRRWRANGQAGPDTTLATGPVGEEGSHKGYPYGEGGAAAGPVEAEGNHEGYPYGEGGAAAGDQAFWAVRDLNFQVAPGEVLGIVGKNGAGKSTLLRLVGGVSRPDAGRVGSRGRVGGFLDLGAGLRGDLTGRQNVFISGVLAGLTRNEVARRLDAIVDFAEIGDFLDSPLRIYSSGMRMRLAFAVAAHTEPDILLIDEVLAVGDAAFRQKCYERLDAFRQAGCAILLASHSQAQIERLCHRALWLHEGRLRADAPPEQVLASYAAQMEQERRQRSRAVRQATSQAPAAAGEPIGTQALQITRVALRDATGQEVRAVYSGDQLLVDLHYVVRATVAEPIFSLAIARGQEELVNLDTSRRGGRLPALGERGVVRLRLERLDLPPGEYRLAAGAFAEQWSLTYDYQPRAGTLLVLGEGRTKGKLLPPHRWQVEPAPPA